MCGRFTLRANLNRILAEFGAEARPEYSWTANVDIRPTTQIPIIRQTNGKRELLPVRWGLVPPWEAETRNSRTFTSGCLSYYARKTSRSGSIRSSRGKKSCSVFCSRTR